MGTHPSDTSVFGQQSREIRADANPLQFKAQASLDVLRQFEDEAVAEAWLVAQRWPNGVHCPSCGCDRLAEPQDRKPMPFRCRSCRTQFSVKSHSAMRGSKLPLSVWVGAFHLCSALTNPERVGICEILPVHDKSARSLAQHLHEAWDDDLKNISRSCTQKSSPAVAWRGLRDGRPRLELPPLIDALPEEIARAFFNFLHDHSWRYLSRPDEG